MAIVIKKISSTEVDLSEFNAFTEKCKGQINIHYLNALNLAIEAANLGTKLSMYKTLLSYTLSELEAETKVAYGTALLNASNINHTATSDIRREAVARQDPTYRAKLEETAKIRALLEHITDCIEYTTKIHYVFKAVYMAETKLPVDTPPSTL
jgi:hypothetical protein